MPAKKTVTITLNMDRETKNTVRFDEEGDEPIISKLYVKKDALAKMGNPKSIKVTIDPA